MADIESNIKIGVDADQALRQLKLLQRQLSAFYSTMAKSGAAGAAVSQNMAQNLTNQINASGKFYAEMKKIKTTTDSFNEALEKNKFGMKEYFRYAGASTKTFGKLFKTEFDTINKVARENVKTLQTQYIKMGRDASGALKAMSIRPLTLDMNDYATKTAMAAQRQALLNQLLRQGSTNLLNFGKNTQWAGRQLMVGFTIPLVSFGTIASKIFMDLEEQAIRFKRVYGDLFTTNTETAKALKDVQALANEFTKYGVAVADTMKMAADVAATGKMGTDLLEQVKQANKLAVLGGIDQQKSLDTIISLTSAFGKETRALSEDINFLNAVENQTILNIDDLTTAIPKAAPVIKQLGGDVQDLAFFMTAMREGGIQAGEGANALKSGLASMINPTEKAAKSLGKMGINIKGIVEANQGDVRNLVIGMAKAFDQLDPLNRARAIEQLFGKFQFARISTLFQNVIKEGSQAQTVAGLTQATVEELAVLSERELKKVEDSPLYKFKKEVQDLKTAIAPVGAEFLKALTPIVKFFGNVFANFENFGDGTKRVMVLLTAVLAGIGPLALMSFGLLANGIANIIKGFTAVKSLFNKTGSSTQILGEQTSYLTQEQLRAAGVAASLDQAHMKLTQRFTSETAAVRNLSLAYQQAIATQSMFGLGAVRGKGGTAQQPKGYAKGVVSVPGSGTGDKVPAMLSPKEAVIPAPMAKKYAPLISGMIADNIPGFAEGKTPRLEGGQSRALAPYTLMAPGNTSGGYGMSRSFVDTKAFEQSIRNTAIAAGSIEGSFRLSPKLVADLQTELVPYTQQIADALKESAKDTTHISQAFEKARVKIDPILAQMQAVGGKTASAATGLQKTFYPTDEDILKGGNFRVPAATINPESGKVVRSTWYKRLFGSARSFDTKIKTLTERNPLEDLDPKSLTRAHVTAQDRSLPGSILPLKGGAMSLPSNLLREALQDLQRKSMQYAEKIGIAGKQGYVEGLKKVLKINSPAKEPQIAGTQSGKGYLIGLNESVDDAAMAGRKTGNAYVSNLTTSQSANALYGKSTGITATDKSIRRQQEKLSKQNQMMAGSNGGKGKVAGDAKGPRAGMIGMAASTAVMGASMMGGKVGDTAQQLMGPIMMVSMLFGMMSAPLAAVVSLIGLLAFGIFKLNKAKKDEMKATLKLIDSMGTGIKPMQEFSKFAGTVTATEIMNRRRANFASPFPIKTGKTTFGESFVASDEGKARVESIQKTISKSGKEGAISDLSNQLIGSVVSGALDYKQARSIAANIGDAIQDYDFSIAVNTKLISMLGPGGENVLKDGITIQTKLIEEQRNRLISASNSTLVDYNSMSAQEKIARARGYRPESSNESGAAVFARMKVLLETQQQMLDVTEVEYSKKIEAAKIAGDLNEVNKLILEREEKKAALLNESRQNYDVIQNRLEGADPSTIKAMRTAAQESIKQVYMDSPLLSALAAETGSKLNKAKVSEATKLNIELGMATQDLNPETVANILTKFTDGKDIDKILSIMPKVGGKDANLIYDLADNFASSDKALEFIYSFETKTPEESRKELEAFNAIRQLAMVGEGVEVPVLLDYAQTSGASAKISEMLEKINNTSAKDLTLEFAVKTVGQKALDELVARGQDWKMMPEDQKRNFLAASTAMLNLKGDPTFVKAYKNWSLQAGNIGKSIEDFIGYGGYKVTEQKLADTSVGADAEQESESGGGPTGSPLDDIVKKLRDVRKATQEMTMGWNDSGNALKKLAKETLGFGGLAQKLRGEGAGQNTIDFITGLSAEDYDKYKSMFKDTKVLQQSLNSIAIGDYVENQRKSVADSKNQAIAFNVLTKSGMSLAGAYDAIKDSSFAAAVAQAKGADVLKLVKERQLTLKEIFNRDISTGQYSNQFDPGFDAAMKLFEIQEKLIRQKRKGELDAQQLIIDNSNKQIKLARNIQDANNYQIARYEDGLKSISDQAEAITEKYDKQFAALDKISKINEVISRQEKSRISIAEALSQGDIYAAARAAQELRAQNAQDAIDQQRTGMEASRDAQIGRLSANGLTRDQLEEKVKLLKEQNYRIDQDTIAPLQEQARLAQVKVDLINEEIKAVTEVFKVANMTKTEWEEQKLRIEGAEVATGKYKDALDGALGVVETIKTTYDQILETMRTLSTMTFSGFSGDSGPPPPDDKKPDDKKPTGKDKGSTSTKTNKLSSSFLSSNKYAPLSMTIPGVMGGKQSKLTTATLSNIYGSGTSSYIPQKYITPMPKKQYVPPVSKPIKKNYMGGMIKKFAFGGFAVGTDTVPAMLTPGEFIVSKYGVDKFGVDNLRAINKGENPKSSSVYNYNLSVNVKSDANPNEIARTVMMQIKQIDSQRIKGNRI